MGNQQDVEERHQPFEQENSPPLQNLPTEERKKDNNDTEHKVRKELAKRFQAEADLYTSKAKEFMEKRSIFFKQKEDYNQRILEEKEKYKQEKRKLKDELKQMFKDAARDKDNMSRHELKKATKERINLMKRDFMKKKAQLLEQKQKMIYDKNKLKAEKEEIKAQRKQMKHKIIETATNRKELKFLKRVLLKQIKRDIAEYKKSSKSSASTIDNSSGENSLNSPLTPVKEQKVLSPEEQIIEDYKQVMLQYRQIIMFGDNNQVDVPLELQHKHSNIRKTLGLNEGNPEFEGNLSKTLRIVDIVNSQHLFVYRPDQDSEDDCAGIEESEEESKSYFNNESRE